MLDIITGDCRDVLHTLPAQCVQACITSPPYFWQRAYLPLDVVTFRSSVSKSDRRECLRLVKPWASYDIFRLEDVPEPLRDRFEPMNEMGHEDTVAAYVEGIVEAFRGVRHVLRKDGAAWLVMGDTYYSGTPQRQGCTDPRYPTRNWMRQKPRAVDRRGWDIPKKSLLGIPWRVAHALQEDGWVLRQEVIWHHNTVSPEASVRDRPHRKHETMFLLSRSGKYHFDRAALGGEESVWSIPLRRQQQNGGHGAAYPQALAERCIATITRPGDTVLDPFLGTGTTALAALQMGRRCVGIEVSPTFSALAQRRLGMGEQQ